MNEQVRYHHLVNLQHYCLNGIDQNVLSISWGLHAEHSPLYFEDVVCNLDTEINISQSIIRFVEKLATVSLRILTLPDQENLILTGQPDSICHLCTKGNHCLHNSVLAEDIYTHQQVSNIMTNHGLNVIKIDRVTTPPTMQISAHTLRSLLSLNLLKKSKN